MTLMKFAVRAAAFAGETVIPKMLSDANAFEISDMRG